MTQQHKQTVIDISAGDLSGIDAIEKRLDKLAKTAADVRESFEKTGGRAASPEEMLKSQEMRNQELAQRIELEKQKRESLAARQSDDAQRRQQREEARAVAMGQQRVLGAGQLGAGTINAMASGSPGGILGGLSALTMNPYALAGLAIGGAGLMAAKQGFDEGYSAVTGYREAIAGVAPFGARGLAGQVDLLTGLVGGTRLGYGPTDALRRFAGFVRSSGLEDRGLGIMDVLALERTRGISAEVSGGAAAIFGAGAGGIGGRNPEETAKFFRASIGEGLAQGLKNAKLPDYLARVADLTTRFAARGMDVDPLRLLAVQAGLRATGSARFEGTRALDAIQTFQDVGEGLRGRIAGVIPPQALQDLVLARYLREAEGNPVRAMLAIDRDQADGTILDRFVGGARGMFPGSPSMAAFALLGQSPGRLSMRSALDLLGYGGRRGVADAPLEDASPLLNEALRVLRTRAEIEGARIGTGEKYLPEMEALERAKESFKGGAARAPAVIIRGARGAVGAARGAIQKVLEGPPPPSTDGPMGSGGLKFRGPLSSFDGVRPGQQVIAIVIRDERGTITGLPVAPDVMVGAS